jgi:hypothetical protein
MITFGHKALYLGEYLRRLNQAVKEVLNRDSSLAEGDVSAMVSRFLQSNRYPTQMPSFVELRCYLSGEVVLLGGEVSPYPKLGLRLLMPPGVDVAYDLPLSTCDSSVRRSVAEMAQAQAESRGAKVAVQVDRDGCVGLVDNAELFAVKEYVVVVPRELKTVEGRLLAKAVSRVGLQIEVASLVVEDLEEADEIFYADCRGVTALGSFNGHPLMHILAEKVAAYF